MQIAQSVLEMKKMARSIENSAEAFVPLTDHEQIKNQLIAVSVAAQSIAGETASMYRLIAREAARP